MTGVQTCALPIWKNKKKTTSQVNSKESIQAANAAGSMVNKIIDNTTFEPDTTTMADLYKADQLNCK